MQIDHGSSRALQNHTVRGGALWFGLLCGPVAALVNEAVEYVLVSWSCGRLDPLSGILLHVVPAALILLCAIAAVVAWRARRAPIGASDEHHVDADGSRRSFMALVAVGLCGLGALAIVAQWIPVLYVGPCVMG